MQYLLDTHVFIWWGLKPEKLSKTAYSLIESTDNAIYVSLVSLWEMQIKSQLDKLDIGSELQEFVQTQTNQNAIQLFPIRPEHIYAVNKLPFYHRDPFDRLLIAQTYHEGFSIISADKQFNNYPVNSIW